MSITASKIYLLVIAMSVPSFFVPCFASKRIVLNNGASISKLNLSPSNQRKVEYYFLEAQRLKILQQSAASFDLFNRCIEIDSLNAAVYYELADYYLKLNNPTVAVDCVRKASRIEPDNYWYLYSLANLSQSLNLNDEAERALTKLTLIYPDKPELNYSLVELYSQKKDYKKAILTLDKLEAQVGLGEEISIEKFKLYTVLKDPKKAFAEIQKLVQGFPKDIRYKILLGDMYLQSNQVTEAYAQYQVAKSIEADNAFLSVSMANYYEKIGDKEKSDVQIRQALMNPKTEIETKTRILHSYLSTRLDKAVEAANIKSLFESLIEMHPQEDSFYQLYADYLISQKKIQEAKEKLVFAVGLSPTNVELWKQLLNVNLQLSDYKSVIEVCNSALEYFPEASEFYFYKGMGYFLSENLQKALETYQAGLKVIDPKNKGAISDFYAQIGDVYQRLDKIQLAYEAYDNALKNNENNVVVLNNYAYYLSVEKRDLSKAEQMSGKCIVVEPNNSTYLDTYAWIYFVQKKYTLAKFYIEKALKNGGEKNEVVVEHYGDILVMSGDISKGLEQWSLSLSMGNNSETLKRKIATQTYLEEPEKK
jgi:tetratricopeptide (TPR) repeat protein